MAALPIYIGWNLKQTISHQEDTIGIVKYLSMYFVYLGDLHGAIKYLNTQIEEQQWQKLVRRNTLK